MVQQKGCKERRQVDQRKAKGFSGQGIRVLAHQGRSVGDEAHAEHDSADQVDPGAHAEGEGHQAGRGKQQGV